MGETSPSRPGGIGRRGDGGLAVRVGSALILAPLALLTAYVGGIPFEVFWGIAAIVVMWEWTRLVADAEHRVVLIVGVVSVAVAVLVAGSTAFASTLLGTMRLPTAIMVLVVGMLAAVAFAPKGQQAWVAAGIPYAGAIGIGPVVLRSDDEFGFLALVFLFAVVWTTDIAAFFAGRTIGGPKLAPRISPNKTWSGAVGGVVGGGAAALAVAITAGLGGLVVITLIAVGLSVAAQLGDLFESGLKRRFGMKDSSRLIPGHGGLMDRLDGFVAAAALACVVGLVRDGVEAPARGLLVW
jgi:phosphatidate cytidylyltransferase